MATRRKSPAKVRRAIRQQAKELKRAQNLPTHANKNSEAHEFLRMVDHAKPEHRPRIVRARYEELFGMEPPKGTHFRLLHLAVAYELFDREGLCRSEKMKQRLKASRKLDLSALDEDCRQLVSCYVNHEVELTPEQEAEKMAAKTKAAKKAAANRPQVIGKKSKLNVRQTWCKLFADNEKCAKGKRMTDEQITEAIKAEFPDRRPKVFDTPHVVRALYNKGQLSNPVPSKQSQRYDKNGDVLERASKSKTKATPKKKVVAKKKSATEKKVVKKKVVRRKA